MTTSTKSRKKTQPKVVAILKKMLEDKKIISEHLKNGGTFEELRKKGYRFETV